jgi:hypothetical protein
MQISRECPMRAAILSSIAKDAPELEIQLLYVAKEHLTLATISEPGTDRAAVLPSRKPLTTMEI